MSSQGRRPYFRCRCSERRACFVHPSQEKCAPQSRTAVRCHIFDDQGPSAGPLVDARCTTPCRGRRGGGMTSVPRLCYVDPRLCYVLVVAASGHQPGRCAMLLDVPQEDATGVRSEVIGRSQVCSLCWDSRVHRLRPGSVLLNC